ncbi:MAG: hypothetical protein CEN87_723 [Parcubacteria group bacterium Licking1014_1]|nr:MAG: hypothetical protein CEN87_723 [Parcubacteria group bacterium Licking1014_1]
MSNRQQHWLLLANAAAFASNRNRKNQLISVKSHICITTCEYGDNTEGSTETNFCNLKLNLKGKGVNRELRSNLRKEQWLFYRRFIFCR